MKRLAFVMPAYDEATVIGRVLAGLPAKHGNVETQTIVVDDGSKDDTAAVAAKAGATVIRHVVNAGSGGATDTGLEYARRHGFDYAITVDADGQHSAEDCIKIIDELSKDRADVVIGSRLINKTGMPWYRVLGNRGLSLITFMLFGLHVTDSQSGLKGFSEKALHSIKIKTTGMEFCSEIIWRAKQNHLKVVEIPIRAIYTDYSLGKGQSNWNGVHIVKTLIKRKVLELIDV